MGLLVSGRPTEGLAGWGRARLLLLLLRLEAAIESRVQLVSGLLLDVVVLVVRAVVRVHVADARVGWRGRQGRARLSVGLAPPAAAAPRRRHRVSGRRVGRGRRRRGRRGGRRARRGRSRRRHRGGRRGGGCGRAGGGAGAGGGRGGGGAAG